MKKLVPIVVFALSSMVCVNAQQPSSSTDNVADAARKTQAKESAAPTHRVWTNDDFADQTSSAKTAEGKDANPAAAAANTPKGADSPAADDKDSAKTDPVALQQKVDSEWKTKIDDQKAKIANLQREYDLTDRESKIASTTYYADAGNRLRDQKGFADKEAASREKLATLKQQLTDEQTKLADLQEQAHKAGANKAYD